MRFVVSLSLIFSAAAPTAQAAAVRPDSPKPPVASVLQPKKVIPKPKLAPKPKKNKAFLAAQPQIANPRWTAPVRLTRLIPQIEDEIETDAYLDLFLNEEAEDLLE